VPADGESRRMVEDYRAVEPSSSFLPTRLGH
jgi:hypothetical protein